MVWGTNPESVAAVATAGATVLAALAALLAVLDMRRRRATERAGQAALVAAWPVLRPPIPDPLGTPELPEEGYVVMDHKLALRVVNRSNLPVTDIAVITRTTSMDPDEPDVWVEAAPGSQVGIPLYQRPMLAPGEEWHIDVGFASEHLKWLTIPNATLMFRDAAGQMWVRNPQGELKPENYRLWRRKVARLVSDTVGH